MKDCADPSPHTLVVMVVLVIILMVMFVVLAVMMIALFGVIMAVLLVTMLIMVVIMHGVIGCMRMRMDVSIFIRMAVFLHGVGVVVVRVFLLLII